MPGTALEAGRTGPAEGNGGHLNGVDLSQADLSAADLIGADLTNANLTGVNLSNASMAGAILEGVTWCNATCPDRTVVDCLSTSTCAGHIIW